MNRGLAASIGAFAIWGMFPLYWKQVQSVPSLEIIARRLLWSAVFVWGGLLLFQRQRWWRPLLSDRRTRWSLLSSGTLIGLNWWLYIWAVNNGHIVESSLGYFINPLVNIALGTVLLKETLNRWQWVSLLLATAGVAWLTFNFGRPPWIALALALSFGTYGLLRKTSGVGAIHGLAVETALLFPAALAVVIVLTLREQTHFGAQLWPQDAFLIFGGIATAIPLVLFAYGAQRIPYSTVGFIQFLAPTGQLCIGVLVYGEPFGPGRAAGFALIWTALLIYAGNGLYRFQRGRQRKTLPTTPPAPPN